MLGEWIHQPLHHAQLGEWIHRPLHHAGRVDPPTIASCWRVDPPTIASCWRVDPPTIASCWRVDPPTIALCSESGSTDHCIMLAEWIHWPLHHARRVDPPTITPHSVQFKIDMEVTWIPSNGISSHAAIVSCLESATLNLSPWTDTLSAAASEASYCSKESDFWSSFNEDSLK